MNDWKPDDDTPAWQSTDDKLETLEETVGKLVSVCEGLVTTCQGLVRRIATLEARTDELAEWAGRAEATIQAVTNSQADTLDEQAEAIESLRVAVLGLYSSGLVTEHERAEAT